MNDKTDNGGIYKATREKMQLHFDINVSGTIEIRHFESPLVFFLIEVLHFT